MARGIVIAIGGGIDAYPEEPLLKEIYRQAAILNDPPKIVIVPSASDIPDATGKKYAYVFKALGAEAVIVHPRSRKEANDPAVVSDVENMDGIFFTGGTQLRLTTILGGTELLSAIRKRYENGAVLSGSSAGAASMPRTMIAYGESFEALQKGKVELSPGLGFVDGFIYDTHFISRGRLPRLLQVISANPSLLGVGLGEDTGIVLDQQKKSFTVIGTRNVVLVDGRSLCESNIPDVEPDNPISASCITVHILANGCRYDMETRAVHISHTTKARAHNGDYEV